MLFTEYPRHTKGRVDRGAECIRQDTAMPIDEQVVENWRASHGYVLNTFQATLRRYARGRDVTVAQRLKRRRTIYDKLNRFPKMQLTRMNDIAGCRLICDNLTDLDQLRTSIHNARFKHIRQNVDFDYDYVRNPKPSGYRGIHDVYRYVSITGQANRWNGLLIELQYRTKIQHAWATAVEIAGSITGNHPKFDRGDPDHIQFFRVCSEILARKYEERFSCLDFLSDAQLLDELQRLEQKTHILNLLENIQISQAHFQIAKNVIIMLDNINEPKIFGFRRSKEAMERYFALEEENFDSDIVLVRADSSESLRNAFRNYFQDTQEFVSLIRRATIEPWG